MSLVRDRFRFDTIKSVVRWRLADAAWTPSFEHLMDDVHNCMNATASVQDVMHCLKELVQNDPDVAQAAMRLAEDAQDYLRRRNAVHTQIGEWDTATAATSGKSEPLNAVQVMSGAFRGILNKLSGMR